jgi:hypothetical protein
MRAFRFPHVKLKVGEDGALQAARTARRLLGHRVDLRADANVAWDVEQALEADLILQVGCQVGESSLLSAAHLTLLQALAPLTPGVRYAEGCFGRHLLREDPVSPSVQFGYGGRPPPRPPGAGLGVQIDQTMLERWAVDRVVV